MAPRGRDAQSSRRRFPCFLDYSACYRTCVRVGCEHGFRGSSPAEQALDSLHVGLDHLIKLLEDRALETLDDTGLVGFLQGVRTAPQPAAADRPPDDQRRHRPGSGPVAVSGHHDPGAQLHAADLRWRSGAPGPGGRNPGGADEHDRAAAGAAAAAPGRKATHRRLSSRTPMWSFGRWRRSPGAGSTPTRSTPGNNCSRSSPPSSSPKELRRLARKVVDAIDPDGTLPEEELQQDRRFFRMRPTKDGAYAGEFRLTSDCGTKLQALLHPLAKPRINRRPPRTGS